MSHDCKQPVCQLRLDLLDFRLGPPSAGDCNDDQVRVQLLIIIYSLNIFCQFRNFFLIFSSSSSSSAPTTRCRCCAATTLASTCTWTCAGGARPTSTSSPCQSSPNLSGSTTRPTAPGGRSLIQQLSVIDVKNIWPRTIVQWMNEIDPNRGWRMLVTQLPCDCSVSSLAVPKAPTGEQHVPRVLCLCHVARVRMPPVPHRHQGRGQELQLRGHGAYQPQPMRAQ